MTTEMRQKRLLNRIAVLALLIAGVLGAWMMFRTMTPQKPPSPANGQQAGGTLPDEAPAAAVAPAAIFAPAAVSPTVVPLGAMPPTVPLPAEPQPALPAVAPAAAPLIHQGVIAEGEIPPPSPVFVSQPLTAKTAGEHPFGVQMGVFRITANAEKLHDKIRAQGIPVVMETRGDETHVHAGPFASRAKAEHVRAKLEAAGMGKGMLVILRH